MASKSQWEFDKVGEPVYFTSANGAGPYKENLIRDHPVLGTRLGRKVCIETGRHGYALFQKARACHTGDDYKSFWQKLGDGWPIFITRPTSNSADVSLNPDIIKFAHTYRKQILSQPPLCTPSELSNYCAEKKLIDIDESSDDGPQKAPKKCSNMWCQSLGMLSSFFSSPFPFH